MDALKRATRKHCSARCCTFAALKIGGIAPEADLTQIKPQVGSANSSTLTRWTF